MCNKEESLAFLFCLWSTRLNTPQTSRLDAQLNQAKKALSGGQFSQARQLCETVFASSTSDEQKQEACYVLAVAERYAKRFAEAEQAVRTLLALNPDHARALQELGHLCLATQRKEQAAKAFYDATLIHPALVASWRAQVELYQSRTAHPALGHAKQNLNYWQSLPKPLLGAADLLFGGNIQQADAVCRRFLQQHKHHAEGLYILALIDIRNDALDEAEFLLESCCEIAPQHTRARAEFAALLNRIGKYQTALKQAEALLQQDTSNPNSLVLKGVALVGLGELRQGMSLFEEVLTREPERTSLWLQLGHAQKSLGMMKEAIASYQAAIAQRADYGDAYWSLANTKSYRFDEQELVEMQRLLGTSSTGTEDRIHLAFALGKGFEDQGQATQAFEYYRQGNEARFSTSAFEPDVFSQQVDRHIAHFTPAFFAQRQNVGCLDNAPIFIVGLPRAGSTLLEQIISAHSKVDATQELHNILGLAKRLRRGQDYPSMLHSLSEDYFERFGRQFIEQTHAYRQGGVMFIDKMPNNFLHIGLIKLILPNAKIVDARRAPMDCCYSCYKQLFAEGQDFTYDLTAIGQYYRDYQRLMDHWHKVLPDFVLQVNHEDVLEDLEGQVRRILAFCGLEYEPQCLTFYQSQRAVQTPSAAQVRKPINKDGVDRYKAVEQHLQPLKTALGIE